MLQNSNTWLLFEHFAQFPTKKHYLIGLSRELGLAHTTIKRELETLEKEGLIVRHEELRGSRSFPLYQATRNEVFQEHKRLSNLFELRRTKLISFLEEITGAQAIVLFGSYEQGEDDETSDIDLFLVAKEQEIALDTFEKQLNRKIELHFAEEFTKLPVELRNNIVNGVVLSGFLEAFH